MSSRITKTTSSKTVVKSSEEKRSSTEGGEIRTSLLTSGESDNGKNGSHAPSDATVAVEDDGGGRTPDSLRARTLAHIKKRVSQEFSKNSTAKKLAIWFCHVILATVPYVAILLGAIYINYVDCDNHNIPIQLIVAGVVLAILHLSVSVDLYRGLPYLKAREKPAIFTVATVFMIIWLILGCVWVFSIFPPKSDYGQIYVGFDPWGPRQYCHYGLYWFALVFNVLGLAVFSVALFVCCCGGCGGGLLCNVSIITCLCNQEDREGGSSPVQV